MQMLSLVDLLKSPWGLGFLEERGVFVSPLEFRERLRPPARPDLARLLGLGETRLVAAGQQLWADYQQSVLSKISSLLLLERDDEKVRTVFICGDAEASGSRSGSRRPGVSLTWPLNEGSQTVKIAPPGCEEVEPRFVSMDGSRLRNAFEPWASTCAGRPRREIWARGRTGRR